MHLTVTGYKVRNGFSWLTDGLYLNVEIETRLYYAEQIPSTAKKV
jgi:hypothetical protein